MNDILVALIAGGITLIGVLISNGKTQAVMESKIEELSREVRDINSFILKIPVLEQQIIELNRRIDEYHK